MDINTNETCESTSMPRCTRRTHCSRRNHINLARDVGASKMCVSSSVLFNDKFAQINHAQNGSPHFEFVLCVRIKVETAVK